MIILALGDKGSGKTASLRKLAYQRLTSKPKTFIWYHDPQANIKGGTIVESMREARQLVNSGSMPRLLIFRMSDPEPIAELAIRIKDITLVIDEMDRACREKKWLSESVRKLVHEGRHCRVDLWGTFRFTRNVSEDLIEAADVILLHKHGPQSIYSLQSLARRLGQNYADTAAALKPHQFVIFETLSA